MPMAGCFPLHANSTRDSYHPCAFFFASQAESIQLAEQQQQLALSEIVCFVELKQPGRRAANVRESDDARAVAPKMFLPMIASRMKSRVSAPGSGSSPARFGPFRALHQQQASARFSSSSVPACWRAVMCSMWNGDSSSSRCRSRQYSHRRAARAFTRSRACASLRYPA